MMGKIVATLVVLLSVSALFARPKPADDAQPPKSIFNESAEARSSRMAWWKHDRFGMFIHFGLYSAQAKHEWYKSNTGASDTAYDETLFRHFDPDLFDAKQWARKAKAAGMKYVVLTTKHHEGFCLWDTATTDFKITNTAFGRDLVKEYVEALREEGLKVGFYFSLMDWHDANYTVDIHHPLFTGYKRKNRLEKTSPALKAEVDRLNAGRDMDKFRDLMFAQVRELLTNYGKIDLMWFDFTPEDNLFGKTWRDWDAVELLKMSRELQPGLIVDNRLGLLDTDDGWDFVTPEQFKVAAAPTRNGKPVDWETCQTFSGSWGYYRDENTWKSPEQLVELLIHTVSFGGNLIMNVGPTGRGDFDWRANDRLAAFEKWMRHNSRSIYGCTQAPDEFKAPAHTLLTYNPEKRRLYIHLLAYPMERLNLPAEFADRLDYVQFLHDASRLNVVKASANHSQNGAENPGGIALPVAKPDQLIPVIECFLKEGGDK